MDDIDMFFKRVCVPQHGVTIWTGGLHIFPLPLMSSTDRERDGKDREGGRG